MTQKVEIFKVNPINRGTMDGIICIARINISDKIVGIDDQNNKKSKDPDKTSKTKTKNRMILV